MYMCQTYKDTYLDFFYLSRQVQVSREVCVDTEGLGPVSVRAMSEVHVSPVGRAVFTMHGGAGRRMGMIDR